MKLSQIFAALGLSAALVTASYAANAAPTTADQAPAKQEQVVKHKKHEGKAPAVKKEHKAGVKHEKKHAMKKGAKDAKVAPAPAPAAK